MKKSQQLTEEISKEFSVSSADEIKLRTKLHELKNSLIKEFSQNLKLGYGDFANSQDIVGIPNKQADDYDNQSEEVRQRG